MIVKMKFINISGPRNDIDRVTDQYLSRYEIQLESALSELKTVENLRPFVEINPYRDVLAKAVQFVSYLPNADTVTPDSSLGLDDMFELVRNASADYEDLQRKNAKIKLSSSVQSSRSLHRSVHWNVICIRYSATGSSLTASVGSQQSIIIKCRNISWMTWVRSL